MRYLIDGYNYLFRLLHKNEEVRAIRDELISYLSRMSEEALVEISLVFDSKYQKGEHTRRKDGDFELVFTDEGESADDWILRELKRSKNPKVITVVTSDRRLAMHCRNYLAQTMECKDFQLFIQKKSKLRLIKASKEKAPLKNLPIAPPKNVLSGFDYYLQEFEKRVADEPQKKPIKTKKTLKKKPKIQNEKLTESQELERWEKLFSERMGDGA
ncbi:MAG: NYN domain-containing protein [Parachlamydiaceae bacterium]